MQQQLKHRPCLGSEDAQSCVEVSFTNANVGWILPAGIDDDFAAARRRRMAEETTQDDEEEDMVRAAALQRQQACLLSAAHALFSPWSFVTGAAHQPASHTKACFLQSSSR